MFTASDQSNCIFDEEEDVPDDTNFGQMRFHIPFGLSRLNNEYTSYVGTIGTGVLKKVVTTSIEQMQYNQSSHFDLVQNYPNPFNPSTKISWQSPVTSHQILKVYDVLGNEVATLVNEERPAGSYEIDFNASKLSSGIYFYKLLSGAFISTKKMILMK